MDISSDTNLRFDHATPLGQAMGVDPFDGLTGMISGPEDNFT